MCAKQNFSGPNIAQEQHLLYLVQELKVEVNDNKIRMFKGGLIFWKISLEQSPLWLMREVMGGLNRLSLGLSPGLHLTS